MVELHAHVAAAVASRTAHPEHDVAPVVIVMAPSVDQEVNKLDDLPLAEADVLARESSG